MVLHVPVLQALPTAPSAHSHIQQVRHVDAPGERAAALGRQRHRHVGEGGGDERVQHARAKRIVQQPEAREHGVDVAGCGARQRGGQCSTLFEPGTRGRTKQECVQALAAMRRSPTILQLLDAPPGKPPHPGAQEQAPMGLLTRGVPQSFDARCSQHGRKQGHGVAQHLELQALQGEVWGGGARSCCCELRCSRWGRHRLAVAAAYMQRIEQTDAHASACKRALAQCERLRRPCAHTQQQPPSSPFALTSWDASRVSQSERGNEDLNVHVSSHARASPSAASCTWCMRSGV